MTRVRIALIVLALLLMLFSLAALAYALSPTSGLHEQVPLAPTLFLPP